MQIVDGIMASSSLPGIFNLKKHKINHAEMYLRDGGLYNNSGINILGDDQDNPMSCPKKTIWIIYSTVDFHSEDKNTKYMFNHQKSKLNRRRVMNIINLYLTDIIEALLSIFLLPFYGLENVKIHHAGYCHRMAIQMGYEPVILTTDGQAARNFKRTMNEINGVKRNAFLQWNVFAKKGINNNTISHSNYYSLNENDVDSSY